MFALVDCNNFYASCERVFNPNLQGKPVAILSNNDGCVISMSDEAKKIGLPFGAPIFKWDKFCKQHNISVLSSNYPLYGDMSERVMKILAQFSPDIEVYSVDESFLELKGFDNINLEEYATKIRSRILQWTGIPVCVGIAPTKALSKVANKIARSNIKQSKGICIIDSEEKRVLALKWTKIGKVWGIGRRLKKRLETKGIVTAYDFTQLQSNSVLKEFSIVEWRLQKDLQGISKILLEEKVSSKKMIATTRSFEYTFSDIDNIKERVSTFATSCAEKLRKQNSSCYMLIVMLRSDRNKKELEQHSVSKTVVFSHPTSSTLVISKAAVNAVSTIFKKGIKYKRAGVIVTGIVPEDNYQIDMFSAENPKHKPLMQTIDKLNRTFKADKIKLANQDLKRTWKMRQERLSPKYTTNINDVITVK
ncbi:MULTISPECIES: Y-family DNA polymerase [Tenacibaculum]|uniref:Y-family DNA polymerase n=1 Tax=Tenacibaculum TaxID=104267 RepID=UPI001F0B5FDC|nr:MULTISPECIES: Y-family DNA polymerase [Tenacibaculum]MCH3881548.1 Y-family DNA polymerase [Tenacibaculum aquimarinum]MCH3883562.1 Y-family DNA polymerase [Tenacibaculum aquimarinum]MDO6598857.1 Y-family DNA polymerase [Tenacibaculum sp. 1_MG-2023]